jgi:putative tryptophan/tyrosine transport system substrate-binding protein
MKRRAFIAALGGAAAWPMAARGQQPPLPVVGWIGSGDQNSVEYVLAAFRLGLNDTGFVEGQNVTIEYRWSEGQYDRQRELAADLVNRRVIAIVSFGPGALAAKAITSTIPIVFGSGGDPVRLGLVTSLNRPGGNITGVTFFAPLLDPKRLGLLHQMVPQVATVAVLFNPNNHYQDVQSKEINDAARALGLRLMFSTPAPNRRSTPHLRPSRTQGSVRFLSRPIRFSTLGARSSSLRLRTISCPPCTNGASSLKPAA